MKRMSIVVVTACVVVLIGGCSGQKMMAPMGASVSGMEKPMDTMNKVNGTTDTMRADPLMKSQGNAMHSTRQ